MPLSLIDQVQFDALGQRRKLTTDLIELIIASPSLTALRTRVQQIDARLLAIDPTYVAPPIP